MSIVRKIAPALALLVAAAAGCAVSEDTPPIIAAPVELRGTPGNAQVSLEWAGLQSAASYRIFYSPTPGVTETSERYQDTTGVSFVIGGLTNEQTYYFRVASVAGSGTIGLLSGEIESTPFAPPAPPAGLTAEGNGGSGVDLSWEAVAGIGRYYIHYDTNEGVTKDDPYIDIFEKTSHTHGDLEPSATYYYRIASFDERGGGVEGELSEEVSAIPAPEIVAGPIAPVDTSCTTAAHAGASWSARICGPASRIDINQGTAGDDGAALGTRGVARGRASFKTAGIVNSDFQQGKDTFMVFFYGLTGGSEHNWHVSGWGDGAATTTRLTAQRFATGGCSPFCERSGGNVGFNFAGRTEVFQWHCGWESSRAWCDVYDGGGNHIKAYSVDTVGDFGILNFFSVGQDALHNPSYPSVPLTVYDLRFSVL
jgi:hypothetical protein